jgi:hypothetical protein
MRQLGCHWKIWEARCIQINCQDLYTQGATFVSIIAYLLNCTDMLDTSCNLVHEVLYRLKGLAAGADTIFGASNRLMYNSLCLLQNMENNEVAQLRTFYGLEMLRSAAAGERHQTRSHGDDLRSPA